MLTLKVISFRRGKAESQLAQSSQKTQARKSELYSSFNRKKGLGNVFEAKPDGYKLTRRVSTLVIF